MERRGSHNSDSGRGPRGIRYGKVMERRHPYLHQREHTAASKPTDHCGYWVSLSLGSICSWERGRLVRIEREVRKVIVVRSSKKGACFARCADETSALPAPSSSVGLKLNHYPTAPRVAAL